MYFNGHFTIKKAYIWLVIFSLVAQEGTAQVTLNADGPGSTYELINSVLAPGYNVVETPDCVHTNARHIDEVYDSTL